MHGPNFSGRTRLLEEWAGVGKPRLSQFALRAYLSPDPFECLSGLAIAVADELLIHGTPAGNYDEIEQHLGVMSLHSQLVWTLSGGELAKVVLCSALRLRPTLLAIDCTLEELDTQTRRKAYDILAKYAQTTSAVVADNRRMAEHIDRILCTLTTTPEGVQLLPDGHRILDEPFAVVPRRLQFSDLSAGYANRKVLHSLHGKFEPGSVYYLSGPNGSGKSTLAKVLAGVLVPSTGQLLLDGATHLPWRTGNRVLALHFQNPDIGRTQDTLRLEAEAMFRRLSSVERSAEARTYCRKWADAFGLSRVYNEPTLSLPYVLRKRVDLCACLASGASWYFLDEPTLGQDDQFVCNLAMMLAALRDAGAGLIIVSHDNPLEEHLPGVRLELNSGVLSGPATHQT